MNIRPSKIILTGPESVGKSTLGKQLAQHFSGKYIPEYAREYIANLGRDYNYEDVLHIAKTQHKQLSQKCEGVPLFFDTGLVITKVWFQEYFMEIPNFLHQKQNIAGEYFYLLCKPDIPWVKDEVRENGGEYRIELYNKYLTELKESGSKFAVVSGELHQRFENARLLICQHLGQ